MKKKIISTLMAISMCVSAVPMAVCAENDTNAGYLEYTKKFCDECLLNPEESEENRLIYNYFKGVYDRKVAYEAEYGRSYYNEFLGVAKDKNNNCYVPYYLSYAKSDYNVSDYEDVKCVQYIVWGNWASLNITADTPYFTIEEFEELSYDEQFINAAKIYDETGEFIAGTGFTMLYSSPYYVGEDGKGYNWKGDELDIFNGEVMKIYCNPEELNICDGKSVYKYSDVYDGDPDTALRADFYKYIEDNNVEQVFETIGGLENHHVYRNKDRNWFNYIEDLSDELFVTDLEGNVIPNDPNLLQVNVVQGGVLVYVYKADDKYIFEDELGNRIVFSSYNDDAPHYYNDGDPEINTSFLVINFFHNHTISDRYPTDNVIETYLAEEDELKFYNTDVNNIFSVEKLIGDANVDGDVNMADAVLIMQSLSNPNEYKLSEQGLINADYNGDGGVTALDALEIQMLMIS